MKNVINFLDKYLEENDIVVCATSGGVDSMSLLHILLNYKKSLKIICAHVNHNLREESFEEYEFVKEYCYINNVVFEGTIFDKNVNGNFESESRKKRYSYFDEIVNKYSAKYLLTAHHGDDLIETILMRIMRGSTLDGYSGFSIISDRNNYKIVRPLIYMTKEELYNYSRENNIEFREDKTNISDKYTRNRYRHNVLPYLKQENKNAHLKFLKFSNEVESASNFINNYIEKLYVDIYNDGRMNLQDLKNLDIYVLRRFLIKVLSNVYTNNINNINDKHIEVIIDLIYSNKPNMIIDLPLNIKVIKKYNIIEIKKLDLENEYNYEIQNEVIIPTGIIKKVSETNLTNNYVCHLNSNMINLPLYVRNKKDGDYIEVLGLNGKKKIKDIFINEKVDIEKRSKYPVVVDSENNIVWLPGLKKSKYDTLKTKNYDIILWYIEKEADYE